MSKARSHLRKSPREPSILLLVCLHGFPQISETIYTPSLPELAESLRVSSSAIEWTLSVYFNSFALGVFLWGSLADYLGRRRSILIGILVYLFGSAGCGFSNEYFPFMIYWLIQGLGASAGSVVTQIVIRDVFQGTKRQQIFSVMGSALSLSPALGPFIGGRVNELYGWKANFLILFIMGVLVAFYSLFRLPETLPSHARSFDVKMAAPIKRMLTDKKIWRYTILIGICNGILFSYYAEAPFLFIELLKLSPTYYGFLGVTVALLILGASKLSHRISYSEQPEVIIFKGACLLMIGNYRFSWDL